MDDDELMHLSTIPYDLRRLIDVEDKANISCAVDQFPSTMNRMHLKNKLLMNYKEYGEDPADQHAIEDAKETDKQLMKTRIEASRRFGIYYTIANGSCQEERCLKSQENLEHDLAREKGIQQKLDDKVAELILDGAVLTKAQHVDTGGTVARRDKL